MAFLYQVRMSELPLSLLIDWSIYFYLNSLPMAGDNTLERVLEDVSPKPNPCTVTRKMYIKNNQPSEKPTLCSFMECQSSPPTLTALCFHHIYQLFLLLLLFFYVDFKWICNIIHGRNYPIYRAMGLKIPTHAHTGLSPQKYSGLVV